jgi:hypothetical protein
MNQTIAETISSTIQQILTSYNTIPEITAIKTLSSAPIHPYEILKQQYFSEDYVFKTIEDLPLPETFNPIENLNTLTQLQQNSIATIQNNLSSIKLAPGVLFYTASGNEVAVNTAKQQNFIELLEIIKQIPINNLSDEQILTTTKKLLHFYTTKL